MQIEEYFNLTFQTYSAVQRDQDLDRVPWVVHGQGKKNSPPKVSWKILRGEQASHPSANSVVSIANLNTEHTMNLPCPPSARLRPVQLSPSRCREHLIQIDRVHEAAKIVADLLVENLAPTWLEVETNNPEFVEQSRLHSKPFVS